MNRQFFKTGISGQPPRSQFRLQLLVAAAAALITISGSLKAAETVGGIQIELTTKQIEKYLTGFYVKGVFHDTPWTSYFSPSGSTTYQVPNSRPSVGQWQAKDDTYCSRWPPSNAWECYRVTAFENQMTFIPLDGGDHWPGERTTEK